MHMVRPDGLWSVLVVLLSEFKLVCAKKLHSIHVQSSLDLNQNCVLFCESVHINNPEKFRYLAWYQLRQGCFL